MTALVASLVFCAGLLTLTYAATNWFTTDPATIASWQSTWSPRHSGELRNHYDDIATYLIRENGDSAGNCLLIGPLLGLVFGVAGATLGRRAPGAHSGGQPPRGPRVPDWLHWLATAGGLGAWRVYPYGIAFAVELTFVPAIGPDNVDGGAMTWFMLVASGSAASLGLIAGFAVARTTGSIGRGVLVGGLTPLIGVALADLGLGPGWGTPAMPDRIDAILFSMPVASLCITLGLVCGAAGGALARPHQAPRAFTEAQQRGPI